MRNILLPLVASLLILSVSCKVLDQEDNNHFKNLPNGWTATMTEDLEETTNPRIFKHIDIEDINFDYSGSSIFNGKGCLELKWFSIENIEIESAFDSALVSTDNYWLLRTLVEYEGLPSYSEYMYKITPETGEILELDQFLGITDGQYIWSQIWWRHIYPLTCWHVDEGPIWSNDMLQSEAGSANILFLGNNMLYYDSIQFLEGGSKIVLYLVNPANGKIYWMVEVSYDSRQYIDIVRGESSNIALIDIFSTNNGNIISHEYYTIDTQNLDVDEVFKNEGDLNLVSNAEYIFSNNSGTLFEVNEELNGYEAEIRIKNDAKNVTILEYKPGEKEYFLVECNDNNRSSYLVNTIMDRELYIPFDNLQIINHTLITTTDNQIQSINPETLEPIWWIDLDKEDLGDNPRVIWCDWRGVLVMSDTKLACFTEYEKKGGLTE